MSEQPEKLFEDVEQFIAENRAILARGEFVELEGLDGEVKRLCESILQLSQDERVAHSEKLQSLLNELNALANELAAQRDKISGEIHALSQHRQAHVAYKKADSTDEFGSKNKDES